MKTDVTRIVFFDTEVNPQTGVVTDIGATDGAGRTFHSPSKTAFAEFLKGASVVCGHNVIRHDLKFVGDCLPPLAAVIDTLPLSPLLFPRRPYHKLLKDDKLFSEELNNPLNDSFKAKTLFDDEVAAWALLPPDVRDSFVALLADQPEFMGFFRFLAVCPPSNQGDLKRLAGFLNGSVCANAPLEALAAESPVELAYALALIRCNDRCSVTPPWLVMQHPKVERLIRRLCATPCLSGCAYCREKLDVRRGLKRFFGFDAFRSYAREPLQEDAARAALEGRSLLAVFPTGGGKSVTFQVPALMAGETEKGLTVVISPLQSLMKDQVDNLEARGITGAVAISGLLDPIEHAKAIERVADGSASLLYIAPESLRSATMGKLLLQRNVVRFVIDEAHCFSSWGQDFRPDYLYIGAFIKNLQERKLMGETIPVSCFTATAKQRVIEDICAYFKDALGLTLDVFVARSRRENLHYVVLERTGDEEKYSTVRDLIEQHGCPTIIYVSRTRRTQEIANHLVQDGFDALPFHGKMERETKAANQNAFLSGQARIMVATTAFGMGVDKKDVGMVIHYDISDSIENYVQEAGRAGRDENIRAECYVLFNEDDLNKHFLLLNQTKLNISEIQQVWSAIKIITRLRPRVQQSALEIARAAGWDDTSGAEIETRVLTALTALEQSGYLKRGQNSPRIYANSILCPSMMEASKRIAASSRFASEAQRVQASRIMANLFGARSRKSATPEGAESRVDYISDRLGIVREEVIRVIQILREEGILADQKDLTAHIAYDENENRALRILAGHIEIERFLQTCVTEDETVINVKDLNEKAEASGCRTCDTKKIHTLLNYWDIKHLAKRKWDDKNNAHVAMGMPPAAFAQLIEKRAAVAQKIVTYLYGKQAQEEAPPSDAVAFSILELVRAFNEDAGLFKTTATAAEVEDALFYLSRIGAMKIEGGFMVVYNRLTIERKEPDLRVRYKKEDYKKLAEFYENRVQQIHIVGEYAQKMMDDYAGAVQFVDDYFRLNFPSFLGKYFPRARQLELRRNITPKKYRQLFESLSETQRRVIDDKESRVIVVAAGPGSGKTKLLVHKLAALLLMEDVKHEQLLMLTFSRAAATEFKRRLVELVGNAANFVEIKTFHSYCFDLLGRVGTLEKTGNIIRETVEKIRNGEVEQSRITKTVLVIDEAQDMSSEEFALVRLLMERNETLRVIAVGDDDQNIYAFRGSESRHFASLLQEEGATRYDLVTNYRARPNLVAFSNQFARTIADRMKRIPVEANASENGIITIVRYASMNLAEPLVQILIRTGIAGSTAVLTRDNIPAEIIAGLLNHCGLPARLIQSNDGFSLADIDEIRFFSSRIAPSQSVPAEVWEAAKASLYRTYPSESRGLAVCDAVIRAFETANTRTRYRTDFDLFVRESRLEDFSGSESREVITVSTMHKAKGREFDNVFLLVTQPPQDDDDRRLLYVALTRTRTNLVILTTTGTFDGIQADGVQREEDSRSWGLPTEITMILTHKDVWLDFFERTQSRLDTLCSGDPLNVTPSGCSDKHGQPVLRFSKNFLAELERRKAAGYSPVSACVNFVVWWKKQDASAEQKIVLPEIVLRQALTRA
jgi:ATP-dependent DNA helicase RecQ